MALVVVRPALVEFLEQRRTYLNTLTLRLFANNITPADTDVVGDYTEATFTGYAAIATVSWGAAYLNANNIAQIDEIVRTFTQTGTTVVNNIYGYYLTAPGGALVFAERNPAGPIAMAATGATYSVQCRMTERNQVGP